MVEGVAKRASSKSVRTVFTASGESNRRRRAFEAAQHVSRWFGDPARGRNERPHIVAMIDETGRVIARDTDPNRMFGEPLIGQVPALRALMKRGGARFGVWRHDDKLLQVGVAAVRNEEDGFGWHSTSCWLWYRSWRFVRRLRRFTVHYGFFC